MQLTPDKELTSCRTTSEPTEGRWELLACFPHQVVVVKIGPKRQGGRLAVGLSQERARPQSQLHSGEGTGWESSQGLSVLSTLQPT